MHNGLATAYLMKRQFEEAAAYWELAIAAPNASVWWWAHLAAAYGHLGNVERAEEILRQLLFRYLAFTIDYYLKHASAIASPEFLSIGAEGLRKVHSRLLRHCSRRVLRRSQSAVQAPPPKSTPTELSSDARMGRARRPSHPNPQDWMTNR
jgi:tetratricopeptide (TPR) repeat protein